jgi:hypothetical protein
MRQSWRLQHNNGLVTLFLAGRLRFLRLGFLSRRPSSNRGRGGFFAIPKEESETKL